MPRREIHAAMPASCETVFDLVYDYSRRMEWDTLLSAAFLENGATVAAKGVEATCVGSGLLKSFALTTTYVSFERPKVAAVRMINCAPFLAAWAASIRHEPGATEGESVISYVYNFRSRPRWLAWFIEPLMNWVLAWETKKRLAALRTFLQRDAAR